MPTETQPAMVILSADPNALVRAMIDHHDPEYAHEVFAALKRELEPSAMDILASLASGYTPRPAPDPANFSEQQREIVRHIYRETQTAKEEHDAGFRKGDRWWRAWWSPNQLGGEMTPSRRASISRALRRLEEREIVSRWQGPGGRRSVSVTLTTEGTKLAERLINETLSETLTPTT